MARQPHHQLARVYGDGARWRLRMHHLATVLRLLARGLRDPATTRRELAVDRWAHDVA